VSASTQTTIAPSKPGRETTKMNAPTRKLKISTLLAGLALAWLALGAAQAAAETEWRIHSVSNSTVADGGELRYYVDIRNVGDEVTDGSDYTLTTTLPEGFTFIEAPGLQSAFTCPTATPGDTVVVCTSSSGTWGEFTKLRIAAKAGPGVSGTKTAHFTIEGGGGAPASTVDPVRISPTPAPFDIEAFDAATAADEEGNPFTQAAGHPFAVTNSIDLSKATDPLVPDPGDFGRGDRQPVEPVKDLEIGFPPGFAGIPKSAAKCSLADLSHSNQIQSLPLCSPDSQVGTTSAFINGQSGISDVQGPFIPVFNMEPPPGVPARFGFNVLGTVVTFDARLRSDSDYGITVASNYVSEGLPITGGAASLWGVPSADAHDDERACPGQAAPDLFFPSSTCDSGAAPRPFFRTPTSCSGAIETSLRTDSWYDPGDFKEASTVAHELPGYPLLPGEWGAPAPQSGCEKVPVRGELKAQPTTLDAESSSGLAVHVEVPNPGLSNPDGISSSDLKGVSVALPQGVTINPSQAEGLGVCSPGQYESSRLEFHPDGAHGCPSDSKIGTVEVKTPILEETIPGAVYVAKPYDNPFNSLLALYIVFEEPQRGVLVKLPGEIRLNEETGRVEASFEDLPQVPFDTFDFHFREGARAPLVTPSTCGTYETVSEIEGWSDPGKAIVSKSSFEITRGIGGAPCPPGGTPGFKPLFSAGSINNNAGSFTPFNMRIQRRDGEQDMTRFSAVLPPGVVGKLAGVAKCPESAIAVAKSKSGNEEIASPSCPANSEIGHSIVGAGVGSVLTYVPGKVYLGGPFNGRPLSVIAITPVVAGPFDVGTVAVHEALTLNPKTAEVEVDGSASDPIPHILKGIPAKLRDLRVYVDRPDFTLNPTSCDPSSTRATLFGGGGSAFTSGDDVPVLLQDRFQAASCSSLGFKPKLALKLKGGTKRGGHPGLTAIYTPKKDDANVKGLTVRLPRSAFLDQAHIRTICTRVQFAAKACPAGAQYGYIKAWTPLLETPLEGPVWLRSSNHKLPDLVFDLHGLVDVEVATRIDSEKGGIRASLESSPDAPLSKVVLKMRGAKKGLIINSRNLCGAASKAKVQFEGHNGKEAAANPVMQAECGGKGKSKRHQR
jgi:hypothetical protein